MGSGVEIEPAFGYLHPPPAHDSLAPQSLYCSVSGSFLVCPTRALSSFSSPKHNPQFAVKVGSPHSHLSIFSTLLFGFAKSVTDPEPIGFALYKSTLLFAFAFKFHLIRYINTGILLFRVH